MHSNTPANAATRPNANTMSLAATHDFSRSSANKKRIAPAATSAVTRARAARAATNATQRSGA